MSEETTPRGERTRNEILLAALHLFLERGYHGTSMRQISQEAGLALGGIYNHFPSKEDIFTTVALEHHPLWEILPLMNAAEGETVEEFVRDAARRMVAGLQGRTDFLNLMFIELVEFNGRHLPQFFKIILPELMAFGQRFLGEREELRDIPLFILVRSFAGLFFSYVMTDIFIGEQMSAEGSERALDYFVDIYLHGILKPDVPQETP
ncbi:MAG TPA: TetR/AcrR family transcriptional regulator [Anaerolineales bacterium]